LVTSKERTSSRSGAIALLFSSAVMLFVLLFGGVAAADEAATTANAGAAGANTGGNGAAGNGSQNGATSGQAAVSATGGDDAVAPNNATTGNSSNGSASITTGDANATGNSATNNTQQTVVEGHNGVVSITDQNATIFSGGAASANTGGNTAVGNGSQNNALALQGAASLGNNGDAVATNDATVRNESGGDARVVTGDATATGSTSNNTINQSNTIDCSTCLGVVVLGDQNANIVNVGLAVANTGGNVAVGNASQNNAASLQGSLALNGGQGDSVAANTGTASNNSNGSAGIITGDATAVGNVATNNVSQVTNINAPGAMGVIVLTDQNAAAVNVGIAIANTGLNTAVGNLSASTAVVIQGAVSGAGPPADDNVASNDGIASTDSNGTANITTGTAGAAGNRSTTNLTQAINVNTTGHAIVLSDQNAAVINFGLAVANSGGNIAVGNASQNAAVALQLALAFNLGAGGGDNVAANFGSAVDPSNGSASIWTGNAWAAGNESTTNVSQAVNANMTGGLVLPDQNALVINAGIGIANTGLNVAVGNASQNLAAVLQLALAVDLGDDNVASNFGDASTTSNGSASITTGNADSIGNKSSASTNVSQSVDTNGADMVLADQNVVAVDFGVAASNTGLNVAVGNASQNAAATVQIGVVLPARGDAVASNFGDASTESGGDASITTGNANAVGSEAHTNIAQSVHANGANGFLLTNQSAISANVGIAAANTGGNIAVGNAALSLAVVAQVAAVLFGNVDDTVAANFGTSKTKSNGSASIHTGNAAAVGTRSTTNIAQTSDMNGSGFNLTNQTAAAASIGIGIANTGGNIAIGNASQNAVLALQLAVVPNANFPNADDQVASNDSTATTDSNGSAEIWTGSADAIGNDSASTTNITQTSNVNGAGWALVDQNAAAVSVGIAVANSGLNVAVGNASNNAAATAQLAFINETGPGNLNVDDVVVSNNSTTGTTSNGSAKIVTGPAHAVGNASTTNITQSSDFNGKGFTLNDQNANVVNVGLAAANTGLNAAVGNASQNGALTLQLAFIQEAGAGNLNAGDVVAANTADTSTNSDGSASVTTGAASATGSWSTTNVNQSANTNITGNGFSLNDQNVAVVNVGAGIANTGGNIALGNVSNNGVLALQIANVRELNAGNLNADDIVAANSSTTSTNSNGSATIWTGSADATGNKSTTNVGQAANTNISGSGFVLNDQNADVTNAGLGVANTGLNIAVGNGSQNGAFGFGFAQVAENGAGNLNAEDVVASNDTTLSNTSDGSASISTGAAHAIGNDSAATTVINQASNTNISGSGFVLVDQAATVGNFGAGIANTGLNLAAGNVSQNGVASIAIARIAERQAGNFNADDVVAANQVTATNDSNGSANIHTGDAEGIGNRSTTTVNQTANNNITGKGFEDTDQGVLVVNAGVGVGNSGLNAAIGNASQNAIFSLQRARISERGAGNFNIDGDAVASNTQDLANKSNGSANVTTGGAGGYGNISTTTINLNGGGDISVFNVGVGIANSGLNLALGNGSQNNIQIRERARIRETGAGNLNIDGDAVAANTVSSTNWSRGDASITTGNATGYGNTSTTTLDGLSNDGTVVVVNFGIGLANTGLNIGVGNGSNNVINSAIILAGVLETGAGNLNIDGDGVASNAVTEVNDSDGHAAITTGDAYALGNRSATGIVDAEDATTLNFGLAFANTGLNIGAGNTSNNVTTHNAFASAPGGISSNVADLSNKSDGTATIHTGNANAFGNIASNATCQGVSFGPTCPQPTLPELPPPFPCLPGSSNCPIVHPTDCNSNNTCPTGHKPEPPVLARTGGSVETQALLGFLLLAIGVFLRRKARTA